MKTFFSSVIIILILITFLSLLCSGIVRRKLQISQNCVTGTSSRLQACSSSCHGYCSELSPSNPTFSFQPHSCFLWLGVFWSLVVLGRIWIVTRDYHAKFSLWLFCNCSHCLCLNCQFVFIQGYCRNSSRIRISPRSSWLSFQIHTYCK